MTTVTDILREEGRGGEGADAEIPPSPSFLLLGMFLSPLKKRASFPAAGKLVLENAQDRADVGLAPLSISLSDDGSDLVYHRATQSRVCVKVPFSGSVVIIPIAPYT